MKSDDEVRADWLSVQGAGGTEDHTPESYSESKISPDYKAAAAKKDLDITMGVAADDRSYYGDRAKGFRYNRPAQADKEGY